MAKLTQAVCEGMTGRREVCVCQYVSVCEETGCLYNCSEWLVIQVGLNRRGGTGYVTSTRNVTVPLCVCVHAFACVLAPNQD